MTARTLTTRLLTRSTTTTSRRVIVKSKQDFEAWLGGFRWLMNECDRDATARDFRMALATLRLMEARLERALEETTL